MNTAADRDSIILDDPTAIDLALALSRLVLLPVGESWYTVPRPVQPDDANDEVRWAEASKTLREMFLAGYALDLDATPMVFDVALSGPNSLLSNYFTNTRKVIGSLTHRTVAQRRTIADAIYAAVAKTHEVASFPYLEVSVEQWVQQRDWCRLLFFISSHQIAVTAEPYQMPPTEYRPEIERAGL
jgi:hypothetical protein